MAEERHSLTAKVSIDVKLDVPTDITPEMVARMIDAGAHNFVSSMENAYGRVKIESLTTTLGAWYLGHVDGTFEGKVG